MKYLVCFKDGKEVFDAPDALAAVDLCRSKYPDRGDYRPYVASEFEERHPVALRLSTPRPRPAKGDLPFDGSTRFNGSEQS